MLRMFIRATAHATAVSAAMIAVAVTTSVCAFAAPPTKTSNTSLGDTLVNPDGMTLYTFINDTTPGKSACNGACTANWPPLAAAAGAQAEGNYSLVTRNDGSLQWAYKGKPLYTFAKDTKPGDVAGEGFLNGAWHAAKP